MKTSFLVSALFSVSLSLSGLSVSGSSVHTQSTAADVQKRFAGNWRLVKFVNFDEKGVARDAGYDRKAEEHECVEFGEDEDVDGDRAENRRGYLERVGQGHLSSF